MRPSFMTLHYLKNWCYSERGGMHSPTTTPLCKSSVLNLKPVLRILVHQNSLQPMIIVSHQPFPVVATLHNIKYGCWWNVLYCWIFHCEYLFLIHCVWLGKLRREYYVYIMIEQCITIGRSRFSSSTAHGR